MKLDTIVQRWVDQAGKPGARLLRPRSANIYPSGDGGELFSYGSHFTLAQLMPGEDGNPRGWYLLNGDNYSVSTSRHQGMVRDACERSALETMIVPFSCLREGRISRDTIRPIDVLKDRWESTTHHADSLGDVPESNRWRAVEAPDGGYTWETQRHWLGASLFRARCETFTRSDTGRSYVSHDAYFLSAFDEQEPRSHYFLAELPQGVAPSSVAEAFECLKPPEVARAESDGLTVTRQGDVFAIPVDLSTRRVRKLGTPVKRGRLLGLSHTATEVVQAGQDGPTYARGVLYHFPPYPRRPEHIRQPMGNRKAWHLIVKNTVPIDGRGDSRAWSRAGNVD